MDPFGHVGERNVCELHRYVRDLSRREGEGTPCDEMLHFTAAPSGRARRILYCTKAKGLLGMHPDEEREFRACSLFYRYGPVMPPYAALVATEAKRRRLPVRFIGDLDPDDLLVFLSLAVRLRKWNVVVQYAGIDDAWLASCEATRRASWPADSALIELRPFEIKILRRLETLPVPWERLIGPSAMALLRRGFKLELEGATNPCFYKPAHHRTLRRLLSGRSVRGRAGVA
jgi:hypothetical protein